MTSAHEADAMRANGRRHYGLDWLRICAFGLLILYHIGMYFVPWGWHVKTEHPLDWVAIPMMATNSWRLSLLFVVSGFASRSLLDKLPHASQFIRERSARLLLPLIAAMIVIIPPQPWIQLTTQHGYDHDLGWFWVHDYFRLGVLDGIMLPTWQHLWFVAYLWVYTLGLTLLSLAGIDRAQPMFDKLFGGVGLLLIPLMWVMGVALWFGGGSAITLNMVGDPVGHLTYVPVFLFGVGLARSDVALTTAQRLWKPALALSLSSYAGVAVIQYQWLGEATTPGPLTSLMNASHAAMGWTMIVALVGLAGRYLNHDHRWRPMLTEAVFPFYIIHQTIIVVAGWWLLRYSLPAGAAFIILLAVTAGGCWIFYWIGRSIPWLRPLIGLRKLR
ncbi:MAG: acyltransferase family protein [Sphingopyxis sp.]